MSTVQAETGLGETAHPVGSKVNREKDYKSSRQRWGFFIQQPSGGDPHDSLCRCVGGGHTLMGSQECVEYVSEFLETTDYLLVQPISVACFFLTCKLGGAIPLAPGVCAALTKHTCFYNYLAVIESDSVHHYNQHRVWKFLYQLCKSISFCLLSSRCSIHCGQHQM